MSAKRSRHDSKTNLMPRQLTEILREVDGVTVPSQSPRFGHDNVGITIVAQGARLALTYIPVGRSRHGTLRLTGLDGPIPAGVTDTVYAALQEKYTRLEPAAAAEQTNRQFYWNGVNTPK